MTSETIMQVLMVYPDARCIFCEKSDVWCVVKAHLGGVIGEGDTQFEAWDDAASKLPPGSPAGETVSEPKCPYCNEPMKLGDGSYWCMNKKCAEQFYPIGRTAAVPEPVPTEGVQADDYTGEATADSPLRPIPSRIPNIARRVKNGRWTTLDLNALADYVLARPSAPEAAAAGENHDVSRWCPNCSARRIFYRRNGTLFCDECDASVAQAAPIAPAAEGVIQEMVDALRLVTRKHFESCACVIADDMRVACDCGVDMARTALARAEEYLCASYPDQGAAMYDRIRGTLLARAEGVRVEDYGGDLEIMRLVDAIVQRESPAGTKVAPKVGRSHICNTNCSSPCPLAKSSRRPY